VAQIAVLSQLAILCPDAFEHKSDVIMSYLVKKVLMAPSPAGVVWTFPASCKDGRIHISSTGG